jgi:hypothetical protein
MVMVVVLVVVLVEAMTVGFVNLLINCEMYYSVCFRASDQFLQFHTASKSNLIPLLRLADDENGKFGTSLAELLLDD